MKRNIPDSHKAFFTIMAVAVPGVWLCWLIQPLVGLVFGAVLLMSVSTAKKNDWEDLGALITPNVITSAVLVGGTFLVFASAYT